MSKFFGFDDEPELPDQVNDLRSQLLTCLVAAKRLAQWASVCLNMSSSAWNNEEWRVELKARVDAVNAACTPEGEKGQS